MRRLFAIIILVLLPISAPAQSKDGNRLAYLDEIDPYYPSRTFPKLITPQWIGEKGVEAAVILAIDDMRQPKRYEAFLRPILRRLQKIDGRAPLSIMTCKVDPKDPQLQTWLKEGLSIECHTIDHPCPFFKGGFDKAKSTYDRCVDLMHEIPNNKPVAFRMPCCDSLNTPSPRFWAEIFNKTTKKGRFLSIDSSVFNLFTANDPDLPRELVLNPDGSERFRKYLPADRSFVNYIEDYPYPYVLGRLCWQFPCVTPSDWQAEHLHKPNNPQTVKDWKAALDCTVIKKGVFCLVFHPHGWIRNDQVVELVGYAAEKYGRRVKFLSFREAQHLLRTYVLGRTPFRTEFGVLDGKLDRDFKVYEPSAALVDLNNDGYMDVYISVSASPRARVWSTKDLSWQDQRIPATLPRPTFGIFRADCQASLVRPVVNIRNQKHYFEQYDFENKSWVMKGRWRTTPSVLHIRDLNNDGRCEILNRDHVLSWCDATNDWKELPFPLPVGNTASSFTGLRFLDLDGDGKLDVIFSNEKDYGIYLFKDMKSGWSRKVMAGKRGDKDALPMISRNGTNNGFFVKDRCLWWSNEDTVLLKDHVERRTFKELLGHGE